MYKCVKTFAGIKVSMKKGDTIGSLDKELAEDYIRAGFIVEEKAENVINKVEKNLENVKEEVKEVVEEVAEKPAAKRTTSRKKK